MLVRIVKRYNKLSPKNGIVEVDTVEFASIEDAGRFVAVVNGNRELDFEIIDYDRVLIGAGGHGILHNPTGGKVGK